LKKKNLSWSNLFFQTIWNPKNTSMTLISLRETLWYHVWSFLSTKLYQSTSFFLSFFDDSLLSETQGFKIRTKWSFEINHLIAKLKRPKRILKKSYDKIKKRGAHTILKTRALIFSLFQYWSLHFQSFSNNKIGFCFSWNQASIQCWDVF
jgi:hypothetical protein